MTPSLHFPGKRLALKASHAMSLSIELFDLRFQMRCDRVALEFTIGGQQSALDRK